MTPPRLPLRLGFRRRPRLRRSGARRRLRGRGRGRERRRPPRDGRAPHARQGEIQGRGSGPRPPRRPAGRRPRRGSSSSSTRTPGPSTRSSPRGASRRKPTPRRPSARRPMDVANLLATTVPMQTAFFAHEALKVGAARPREGKPERGVRRLGGRARAVGRRPRRAREREDQPARRLRSRAPAGLPRGRRPHGEDGRRGAREDARARQDPRSRRVTPPGLAAAVAAALAVFVVAHPSAAPSSDSTGPPTPSSRRRASGSAFRRTRRARPSAEPPAALARRASGTRRRPPSRPASSSARRSSRTSRGGRNRAARPSPSPTRDGSRRTRTRAAPTRPRTSSGATSARRCSRRRIGVAREDAGPGARSRARASSPSRAPSSSSATATRSTASRGRTSRRTRSAPLVAFGIDAWKIDDTVGLRFGLMSHVDPGRVLPVRRLRRRLLEGDLHARPQARGLSCRAWSEAGASRGSSSSRDVSDEGLPVLAAGEPPARDRDRDRPEPARDPRRRRRPRGQVVGKGPPRLRDVLPDPVHGDRLALRPQQRDLDGAELGRGLRPGLHHLRLSAARRRSSSQSANRSRDHVFTTRAAGTPARRATARP